MRYNYSLAFSTISLAFSSFHDIAFELAPVLKILRMRAKSSGLLLSLFFAIYFLFPGMVSSYNYESGINLISSDATGVVLEMKVGDLTVEKKESEGSYYNLISYNGCAFTSEVGRPRLPVSRVFIGVPPSASISISIADSQFTNLSGYIPLPVPNRVQRRSPNGLDVLADEFTIDSELYRQNIFYPLENAALVYEGYIRHQRVAIVELRPVQYNPATRLLRKYSRLLVKVIFSSSDFSSYTKSPSQLDRTVDKHFEKFYQGLLVNYEDARNWRKTYSSPAVQKADTEPKLEAFKIFVSRSGIYRLDYKTLQGAGMDLASVDPRTIKVQTRGNQIPVYVYGEVDGRFDPEDYIEFFAPESHNIYTRWDVYWLMYGGVRGMRMVQKSSISNARTAQEITAFKSVVRFEEDHIHNRLQNVPPDPDNLEGWFESRDHWFWAGIENGTAKNELTVKFPIYDLPQSMMRPDFKIELVGCTNYEHHIMISINGYRVDEANWSRQDIYSFSGQINANALVEGMNELRLTRIGTNPADGSNADNYPYHIFLNWFEISYVRELMAVNDRLEFFSPEPKDPKSKEVNRYSVAGFGNGDIEVFQIAGSNAVCRFKDLLVQGYELDQEGRDRLKLVDTTLDEPSIKHPLKISYTASFEDQGGRNSQYIAVSSTSVLRPDRIERDVPSNLKDPSNQADYIIISHPVFVEVANELAGWRSDPKGGSFRAKVVDITDIYDEFGYGMVNPKAIKDFLEFAYNNWAEPAISYVLILGDATYDFLGIDEEAYKDPPELIGFIPTFYLWTTFGQTAVDHWYSTIEGDDGFPDVYLGRIPVDDTQQARSVLDKIIANESGRVNGPWRKQIISVADDDTHAAGDEIFQIGMEEIWRDHTPVGYDTEKIYLKDIAQQVAENPEETRRPADIVEEKIKDAFAKGAVIAQYAGHGGRHVWAHEIVFSITDIEEMKETDVYPFLLVLSCYNGYFDLPGELCMAEGMLRANRRGIVAMLSATRLTYGAGNVALNNALFDGVFKDKILRIGQLTALSKIKVLEEEGISWLSQMQEYTLFGDPASRLNIADYEINPQLASASVSPGGKLELLQDQAVTAVGGQPGSFDGQINIELLLPDGRKLSKKVTAARGSYPAASFDIPDDVTGSQGLLKLYGENTNEIVVGGTRFSIKEPILLSLNHEFIGNSLQFYADVNDDDPAGVKSVTLSWLNFTSRSYIDSPMIFDQQKKVYKLAQVIPLSSLNREFVYYITIEDRDGNTINIERQALKLPSKPNLTMLNPSDGSEPSISYGYSSQLQKWGINAKVLNTGTEKVTCQIQAFAFGSNPDQNGDMVVDDDIKPLGQVKLTPEDWNYVGTVSAFIPLSLTIGRHIVFIWLDPEFSANHPAGSYGACVEQEENDNIYSKALDITHILLRPDQEAATRSLDSVLHFRAQAGAVSKDEVITINSVQNVQEPVNQAGVSFVSLPGNPKGGYEVNGNASDNCSSCFTVRFSSPVSLQMKFDLAPYMEEVGKETGLTDISEDQMSSDQRENFRRVLKDRVSGMAIYLWNETARKWAHIPSKPELDDNGNILRIIHCTIPVSSDGDLNAASKWIGEITIDEKSNTPVDEWTILFLDPQHFYVEGARTGVLQRNGNPFIGTVGEEFYHQPTGFRFTIPGDAGPFSAGDSFKFTTVEAGMIQADSQTSGIFSLMLNRDQRPPDIQIGIADQNFADGGVASSEPTIQAHIYDENGVDVLTHNLEIAISKDDEGFKLAGSDDYVIHWDAASNEVSVNYWPGKLEPGEYQVRFQAYDFNGNSSTKSVKFAIKKQFELGKDSLMNYPNPFERETDITFYLTSLADEAIVKIYTVSGRLIRTLEQQYAVNFVVIHWDGKDEDGHEVANGVYYYKVRLKQVGKKDIVQIGKMMKLK